MPLQKRLMCEQAGGANAISKSGSTSLALRSPYHRTIVVAHPQFVATSALHPDLVRDDAFTVRASVGLVCGATDAAADAAAGTSTSAPAPLPNVCATAAQPWPLDACCAEAALQNVRDAPHMVEVAQPGAPCGTSTPCGTAAPCGASPWVHGSHGPAPQGFRGCRGGVAQVGYSACTHVMQGGGHALCGAVGCMPGMHMASGTGQWPVVMVPVVRERVGACGSAGPGSVAWLPMRAAPAGPSPQRPAGGTGQQRGSDA